MVFRTVGGIHEVVHRAVAGDAQYYVFRCRHADAGGGVFDALQFASYLDALGSGDDVEVTVVDLVDGEAGAEVCRVL